MSKTENNNRPPMVHWADITADRIIRQKGDKDEYVLASGITPSGTVHFGNFREVITTDLVARGLRARGKKVRFIFSWDDYDTFRKVPANLPNQEKLKEYMFQPIVDTPDPYGEHESYAAHHENNFERQLDRVGVEVEPIYQAKKYRAGDYKEDIKNALNKRVEIRDILNEYRSTPYGDEYYPISVYCEKYKTDNTTITGWDGESKITYKHNDHDYEGVLDLNSTSLVKLPWRVDWPMRWAFEKVDFEPGGKDHSSQGGSYTTAKDIVKLFDWETPVYLQYDFVSIKGLGGKMSSSKGNLVTVDDILKIYEPEMVRWIFASYKTNVDFSISFDLDVLKVYEDYDKQERLAFGVETGNEKKVRMAKRVIELSQIHGMPTECPMQPSLRHLCNVLQINDMDIDKARVSYADQIKNDRDERRFKERSERAIYWIQNHAPEEFKFTINTEKASLDISSDAQNYISKLSEVLESDWDKFTTDKDLHERMYEIMHEMELKPADIFVPIYQLLIKREKGPKLAGFIRTIEKDRAMKLLK